MRARALCFAAASLLALAFVSRAEIKIVTEKSDNATAKFKFNKVPSPSKSDAATQAGFKLITGEMDANGGRLAVLQDGKLPAQEDDPKANYFLNAGTEGGRLLIDLSNTVTIKQVNTYSWHGSTRGPQVYKLYASDGKAADFSAEPKSGEPEKVGWKLLAKVDSRPKSGDAGGQYGVSISDSEGMLGDFRYLLLDISRTEEDDAFGNTFFSEIDVISKGHKEEAPSVASAGTSTGAFVIRSADDYCEISIDTSGAPELKDWAEKKLAPVLAEWYPKIVAMLPSDGFTAPKKFSISIRPGSGVAATGGTRVTANSAWLKGEIAKGERGQPSEAIGALLHEEVHVIQQYGYGGGRRNNPNAVRSPNWLTEAIPDYIRWFLYEPQSHGADLTWLQRQRNPNLNYGGSYRISANFLHWITEKYDKDIVKKLNAAARTGNYSPDLWKTATGKTMEDLGAEWKTATEEKLASARAQGGGTTSARFGGASPVEGSATAAVNTLTEAETKAGWKLLFNGKDLDGWHNYRSTTIKPGWQVTNSTLACVDPHNAGDLCTKDQYDWFELKLEYNISEGGNSGIMFHVVEQPRAAAWASGPEIQLEDNVKAADQQRCGWLYELYKPAIDPKTSKPIDATKPAGQWNQMRILISQEKCEHEVNGTKYFEYVLGSEDFKQRVAKSKFGKMPLFAKSDKGFLTLQGDHGQVSFRNVKIREIEAKKKD